MSLLIAGAVQRSGARVRGPFAATTVEAGDFAPGGATYTAAEAVYTALGADGYLYGFDFEAMRLTSNAPDGVDIGETVGFAHDWRSVGTLGRAAVADVAAQRPTAATVNGVDGLTFTGDPGSADNQRMALPYIDWTSGCIAVVARMLSSTEANQTILEIGPLRIHASFSGITGPCIRVGNNEFPTFGLGSMLDRDTLLIVQWNQSTNRYRLWYDGAAEWIEGTAGSWMDNPHSSWGEAGHPTVSLLGRTSYVPTNGAPAHQHVHRLAFLDTDAATVAQVQGLADWVVEGTAISATVPAYAGSGNGGGGGTDELPTPLRTVAVANQTDLNNAAAASIAGDQIELADGTYTLPNITRNGSEANPIVYKAVNNQGVTISGVGTLTASDVRFWGFNMGARTLDFSGDRVWFIRCKWTATVGNGGSVLRIRGRYGHVWYAEFDGAAAAGRAIAFDTGTDGRDGHVKGCYFHDWSPGAANASETITIGFTNTLTAVVSNALIEDCLFQDCNIGGQEDETIAIKTSSATVHGCTFIRTRFCNMRHGQNNTIEQCWHEDSAAGGFTTIDYNGRLISCKTVGGSRTEIFAGNTLSGNEDADWYTTTGTTPSGLYPRSKACKVYHHNAVNTAPLIGKQYSIAFNPLRAADGTVWQQNRGLAPTLAGGGLQTNTTQTGTAPVSHVEPVKLSAAEVGLQAGGSSVTAADLFLNPFNANSAHHRRIGTGATYAAATSSQAGYEGVNVFQAWADAGIGTINGANNNQFGVCFDIEAGGDPSRTITITSGSETSTLALNIGNDFPFYTNSVGFGEATVWLKQSNFTLYDLYNHMRSSDGATRTALLYRTADIRGTGHVASVADTNRYGSSAAGMATAIGILRKFEVETPGLRIEHALHLVLPRGVTGHSLPDGLGKGVRLPARYVDGGTEGAHLATKNRGPINYGDLLAIPPADLAALHASIDATADAVFTGSPFGNILSSAAAAKEAMKRIATACEEYGCYAMDGGNVPHFRADFPFTGTLAQAMIMILRQAYWWSKFKRVTNSTTGGDLATTATEGVYSGTSIGTFVGADIAGGGTPLAPNSAIV